MVIPCHNLEERCQQSREKSFKSAGFQSFSESFLSFEWKKKKKHKKVENGEKREEGEVVEEMKKTI